MKDFRKRTTRDGKFSRSYRRRSLLRLERLETRVLLAADSDSPDLLVDPTTMVTAEVSASTVSSSTEMGAAAFMMDGCSFFVDGEIAKISVSDGNDINTAFMCLSSVIDSDPSISSGVVEVFQSTTFSVPLVAFDHVLLSIPQGVTLTLDNYLDPLEDGPALRLTNTTGAGLVGAGTFDINGNARQGVYGLGAQNVTIGNPTPSVAQPDPLRITGWQYAVFLGSTGQVAASDIDVTNLVITDPHSTHVEFPFAISNRPGANGLWATDVNIDNLLVDGGQPNGAGGKIGGAHGVDNPFTADQIVLQGVHNATVTNARSFRGGENGITISWGSNNVTLIDAIVDSPDAHAINIGGGGQALDVVDSSGFETGQSIVGVTSGTTANVLKTFPGRIWVTDASGNRFESGETLQVSTPGIIASTQIVTAYRTANITVDQAVTSGAGINRQLLAGDSGDLLAFSDVFIQQADHIAVTNSRFESRGREIGNGELAEHHGINVSVASISSSNNMFVDYGNNQIPVVLSKNSTQFLAGPETSFIDGTPYSDAILGTLYADQILAEAGDDSVSGGDGDDTLDGALGDDELFGQSGNDQLHGGAGNDYLSGGAGDDFASGDDDDDQIFGQGGMDTLRGGSGNDVINGGNDDDQLFGDSGTDSVFGGAGNDLIFGGVGDDLLQGFGDDDEIFGEEGDDQILGDSGHDILFGGLGSDRLTGGSGSDVLDGGQDDDSLFGDSGNDWLVGGGGNDLLRGGAGADILDGGEGIDEADYRDSPGGITVDLEQTSVNQGSHALGDTYHDIENVFGSDFDDVLWGTDIANRLEGFLGNDQLMGRAGDDVLVGAEGNDILIGGNGADVLNGGSGIDTASYGDSTTGVIVDLETPSRNTSVAAGDSYLGIEIISGTNFDDTLSGNGSSNHFVGGLGNDVLEGLGGSDILDGGAGNDVLRGGIGEDQLIGGPGNDTATYSMANILVQVDLLNEANNAGFATGTSHFDIENLIGTIFNDTLAGDNHDNQLFGHDGDDQLLGRGGDDELIGELGNDQLFGDAGEDLLLGGEGDDALFGGESNDFLKGEEGNDALRGEDGDDVLEGGAGQDVLIGGKGADSLFGGPGIDVALYREAVESVTVDFLDVMKNAGEATGDTYLGIENIEGTDFSDRLSGDAAANLILGHDGDDTLRGRDGTDHLQGGRGDDILFGGPGADTIEGNSGVDTASYIESALPITLDLTSLHANTGDAFGDVFSSIERFVATPFSDVLLGDASINQLEGEAGDDVIRGYGGSDTLIGGEGDDFLEGGSGADRLDGGAGIDTASYADAEGRVHASLADPTVNTNVARNDSYISIENLIGSNFHDTLTGDDSANEIHGTAGNDTIYGGGGDDRIFGGMDDDYLQGDAGSDSFVFGDGWGSDVVSDFNPDGIDLLDLRAVEGVNSVLDLVITSVSEGVLIELGASSVLLLDVTISELTSEDFIFVPQTNALPTTEVQTLATTVSKNGATFTSGAIGFDDADVSDTHGVNARFLSTTHLHQLGTMMAQIVSPNPEGLIEWTYSVNNADIQFLQVGESITEVFRLTVFDSKGGTADVEISVTIEGDSINRFVVDTLGDKPDADVTDGIAKDEDGRTSLRAAMMQANASQGGIENQIRFDLSMPLPVIVPTAPLPAIASLVDLNGSGELPESIVTIDGSVLASSTDDEVDGIVVRSEGSRVDSLVITGFPGEAVEIRYADHIQLSNLRLDGNEGSGVRFVRSQHSKLTDSIIVNNLRSGVQLAGTERQTNIIDNNFIGIDSDGTVAGNGVFGVQVRTGGNIISNNVISGNLRSGLAISGTHASENTVVGNFIGTDASAENAAPNGSFGIVISGSDGNIIGGEDNTLRNIIAGNARSGLVLTGGASGNIVTNNSIGLDQEGNAPIGNGGNGVFVAGAASHNDIVDNRIAANFASQVAVVNANSSGNRFIGNLVGFRDDLTASLPGGPNGFFVKASGNLFDANMIAGAGSTGMHFSSAAATGNVVTNNVIGSRSLDLSFDDGMPIGVQFSQNAASNTFGPGNAIGNSTLDGIRNASGGSGNRITENVFLNNIFGIDLGANRSNPNDLSDVDEGPNRLQNTTSSLSVNTIAISQTEFHAEFVYAVDSDPAYVDYPLTVEFFLSDQNGNGIRHLFSGIYTESDFAVGSSSVTTLIDASALPYAFEYASATVTDASGNTSEFSEAFAVLSEMSIAIGDSAPAMSYRSNDVNRDGRITALDALFIINAINEQDLKQKADGAISLDVNRDGLLSSVDALVIVNFLNTAPVNEELDLKATLQNTDESETLLEEEMLIQMLF